MCLDHSGSYKPLSPDLPLQGAYGEGRSKQPPHAPLSRLRRQTISPLSHPAKPLVLWGPLKGRKGSFRIDRNLYNCYDAPKIIVYVIVRKAKHLYPAIIQKRRPRSIILQRLFFIMLPAVQFDRKFSFRTIKIHNVGTYPILSEKSDFFFLQKAVPKDTLLASRVALSSVLASKLKRVWIIVDHINPSLPLCGRQSPLKRGVKLNSARLCIPCKGGLIARSASGAEWWVLCAPPLLEAKLFLHPLQGRLDCRQRRHRRRRGNGGFQNPSLSALPKNNLPFEPPRKTSRFVGTPTGAQNLIPHAFASLVREA